MNDALTALALGGSILFLSVGQIAQKVASHQIFDGSSQPKPLARAILNPAIWFSAACLILATLFWLFTLSRIEVSKAYPMLSLSLVLTTVLARVWIGERVDIRRWLGVLVILAGATLMAAA